MIRNLAAALLISAAAAVSAPAQGLPALHDVTGVSPGDVLNVRENPRASAPRIGTLSPDATGVEVTALSDSGDWGRINVGERAGWVSMSFLTPSSGAGDTGAGYFDGPLVCHGTEPFWRLENSPEGTVAYTTPDAEPLVMTRVLAALSANRGGASQFLEARAEPPAAPGALGEDAAQEGAAASLIAVLRRAECSDGMSDRRYGLTLDMALTQGQDRGFVSGCCTLAAP